MTVFFIVLAVITAGCVWATESVDRPRRRELRRQLRLDPSAATAR